MVLKALSEKNIPLLKEISNHFYRTNGIYARTCNYFAQMYRYDWYIVPEIYDKKVKTDKIVGEFNRLLTDLDNSYLKKLSADIGLTTIKNGSYYGYLVETPSKTLMMQELPADYCRCRYFVGNMPVVEMNMKFFDDSFPDV